MSSSATPRLSPLEWHGACLLIARSRAGAAVLSSLRAAAETPMPGRRRHSRKHPRCASADAERLHVLLPDGRPLWAPGQQLPMLPLTIARSIEAAIRDTAASGGARTGEEGSGGGEGGRCVSRPAKRSCRRSPHAVAVARRTIRVRAPTRRAHAPRLVGDDTFSIADGVRSPRSTTRCARRAATGRRPTRASPPRRAATTAEPTARHCLPTKRARIPTARPPRPDPGPDAAHESPRAAAATTGGGEAERGRLGQLATALAACDRGGWTEYYEGFSHACRRQVLEAMRAAVMGASIRSTLANPSTCRPRPF